MTPQEIRLELVKLCHSLHGTQDALQKAKEYEAYILASDQAQPPAKGQGTVKASVKSPPPAKGQGKIK